MNEFGSIGVGALAVLILAGLYKYFALRRQIALDRQLQDEKERQAVALDRYLQDARERQAAMDVMHSAAKSLVELVTMQGHVEQILTESGGSVAAAATAVSALTEVMTKAAPSLSKIGDDAFLIARGARDIGDGVTALRAVVFGGKRAEDFPMTLNDDERVERANIEHDIAQLMMDHGLTRDEAGKRIRDMYAGRGMNR